MLALSLRAPAGPDARGTAASLVGRILIATWRSRFLSRAWYTSPIPPTPNGSRISYGPRDSPINVFTPVEVLRVTVGQRRHWDKRRPRRRDDLPTFMAGIPRRRQPLVSSRPHAGQQARAVTKRNERPAPSDSVKAEARRWATHQLHSDAGSNALDALLRIDDAEALTILE